MRGWPSWTGSSNSPRLHATNEQGAPRRPLRPPVRPSRSADRPKAERLATKRDGAVQDALAAAQVLARCFAAVLEADAAGIGALGRLGSAVGSGIRQAFTERVVVELQNAGGRVEGPILAAHRARSCSNCGRRSRPPATARDRQTRRGARSALGTTGSRSTRRLPRASRCACSRSASASAGARCPATGQRTPRRSRHERDRPAGRGWARWLPGTSGNPAWSTCRDEERTQARPPARARAPGDGDRAARRDRRGHERTADGEGTRVRGAALARLGAAKPPRSTSTSPTR